MQGIQRWIGAGLLLGVTGCQDTATPDTTITCADAETPTPYSIESFTVELPGAGTMPDGEQFTLLNSLDGDITGDQVADRAAIVVMQTGGSGSFYYLAVATSDGCHFAPAGSQFLGDRIKVEDVRIMPKDHVDAGMIIVGLRFRRDDQPMAEDPAGAYVTRMYRIQDGALVHLEQY